jgi:hypothetical protein
MRDRRPSYAVLWRLDDGPVCAGRLEVDDHAVTLTGRSRDGDPTVITVARGRIAALWIGRGGRERIDGRPSLVLRRDHGDDPILITEAIGIGGIVELADRLSASPVTAAAP